MRLGTIKIRIHAKCPNKLSTPEAARPLAILFFKIDYS